ncbi:MULTISPECIES: sulfur globule protein precursor [unclassified Bradyrhizobium]|uniref:sulfur globule protein precursor n=1 Tax=unclassified Bradyrhizobium TaxID=2631580 RepID=UPI001CD4C7DB|nr:MULTISPECIES: sulfur globule protein precursor [unclassified Bradyrhizobium]MCA1466697.1 sulfur globule protein precursor [Bradyrhizobium sp. IC3195]MCA1498146.1 sulfur globule protein precursor [Bradyrhizobium sp. NBAIM14]MCA1513042.1 sulfur globule protein precursor [Bradyrhizobium sp. NBAIM01]MCA1531687.1 sulfur globule protein precursor [Bradyrhizobium sp. NBAIM03]
MLRKLSLAAVAAAALGAALAPTSASAHWQGGGHGGGRHHGHAHHHHGHHHGHGWGGPRFYAGGPVSYGYGGCYVRRLVPTPWGPRWRLINRCY